MGLSTVRRRPGRTGMGAVLAVVMTIGGGVVAGSPAWAFHKQIHDQITEAGLAHQDVGRWSLRQFLDAATSPDGDEDDLAKAHCDNADHVRRENNGGKAYPKDKDWRDLQIYNCAKYALDHYIKALELASGLADVKGVPVSTPMDGNCRFDQRPGRLKCDVIEHFGRAMHAIEDFHAHSNWTDHSDPAQREITLTNPYGLAKAERFPVWTILSDHARQGGRNFTKEVVANLLPHDLLTGCFADKVEGDHDPQDCTDRVTHATLSKDEADSPRSGIRVDGKTNRDRAVEAASTEVAAQVAAFVADLENRYSPVRAKGIVTALFQDK
ncbi:MAG: hypothetical protein HOV94_31545 [Saccharothrix sp.]|nr:hypothetical protein [Saccharothrix sp.]